MSEDGDSPQPTDDGASSGVSRRQHWFRRHTTRGERNWMNTLRIGLEAGGFGDRRTCQVRARRALVYRRMTMDETAAIEEFGFADYERAWQFLEETARLASQRPEDRAAAAGAAGPADPLA